MKKKEIRKHELGCQYLLPHIYSNLFDCSDSMHEVDQLEERFLELTGDKQTIQDYVKKNLREAYLAELSVIMKEYEIADLDSTPGTLLFKP